MDIFAVGAIWGSGFGTFSHRGCFSGPWDMCPVRAIIGAVLLITFILV